TWLGEDASLPAYGHPWWLLLQRLTGPRGGCRSDRTMLPQRADRLGFGPDMAGSPAHWIDQLTSTFRHQGISHASLAAAGGRLWPEGTPRVPWAEGKFKTPTGCFVFPSNLDDDPLLPPPEYPPDLIALATEAAINSQVPEEQRRHAAIVAQLHPAVAAARGLGEGDLARLVSPRGSLPVRLACRPDLRRDSVFVFKGDWAKYDRGL